MSLKRTRSTMALIALVSCGLSPRAAQAGPLLDWLFGRTQAGPAYAVGAPVPVGNGGYAAAYGAAAYPATGYAGNYGTYYGSQLPAIGPAGAGYTAPMPTGIAAATLPSNLPSTLSYVPNFQTQAQRAPVTYYRPLLTTDPNTGAQVVAMAPCTSYETMAQRTPIWGRSALFGSNAAPTFQPPSQALPTYTLPSGGIPLAYSSPSITAPYSTAYGVYGTNDGTGATRHCNLNLDCQPKRFIREAKSLQGWHRRALGRPERIRLPHYRSRPIWVRPMVDRVVVATACPRRGRRWFPEVYPAAFPV
ncbi:MAG: hypothetical protein R3C56_31995 [Pirellulaceae bacterium]